MLITQTLYFELDEVKNYLELVVQFNSEIDGILGQEINLSSE